MSLRYVFTLNTNLSYFVYVIETLQGDSLSGDLHLNEMERQDMITWEKAQERIS